MTDLKLEIQSIKELIASIRKMEAEVEERKTKLLKGLDNGETTGDRIKDFVIASCGFVDEEVEAVYRNLEKQVSHSNGQLVLVNVKVENFYPKHRLDERFFIGFLKSGTLIFTVKDEVYDGEWFKTYNCSLPTGNYVKCSKVGSNEETFELVEGNLDPFPWYNLRYCRKRLLEYKNSRKDLQEKPRPNFDIVFGNSEVKELMSKRYFVNTDLILHLLLKQTP